MESISNNKIQTVTIGCSENNKYYKILQLFSMWEPINTLSDKEMRVLSLIFKEYVREDIPDEVKYIRIFKDKTFAAEVSEILSIKVSHYDNYVSILRKKGFIEGHKICDKYIKFLKDLSDNILFKFKVTQ